MATTSNFGWETPDDTDYVKDGAAAMRTLGNSIDTSMGDLKGGTTGQVLSKATNTDMDFAWVDPNDADAIQNSIIDAKGDLIVGSAADTATRLAVGTNGQVLTADSTTATGLKWATGAAGGWTLIATATPSAATTVSFTSIPTTYTQLMVVWTDTYTSATGTFGVRLNNVSTGGLYDWMGVGYNTTVQHSDNAGANLFGTSNAAAPIQATGTDLDMKSTGYFTIYRANSTASKYVQWGARNVDSGYTYKGPYIMHGQFRNTSAISQLDFIRNSTQTITGNFYLYGLA